MQEQPPTHERPGRPSGRRGRRALLIGGTLVLLAILIGVFVASRPGPETDGNAEHVRLLGQGQRAQVEGRMERAERLYREVLADDPTNKYALYNLGLLAQELDRADEAERWYRAALRSDPSFRPALFNLAIVVTPRAPAEAIELYRSVIRIAPDHAEAHLNLGILLRKAGRGTEGSREIARALQLDPTLRSNVEPAPTGAP